jgi:rod shape determining protein RodA
MLQTLKKINIPLLLVPFLLFVIGFVTQFSTSPERGSQHLTFYVVGMVIYFGLIFFDYRIISYIWKYLYVIGILLLLATLFLGESRLGASRWLNIGFFSFQPSEVSKLILIFSVCSYIYTKNLIFSLKNILIVSLISLPLMFLVFIQPDLGTTLVMFSVLVGVFFYSGVNKSYFLILLIFFGLLSNPIWNLLQDYQKQRIMVYVNPQLDTQGSGYNVIQSLIAVGSGGLFGQGYSKGTQTHLNFLPAYWTDFVFASYAEEWGLFGVIILFLLYFLIFYLILYLISKTNDIYGKLLGFGIFTTILVQFIINTGMNLGLLPVTGIPLPLLSSGGSSMIVTLIMLGLLQSIWVWEKKEDQLLR